MRTLLSTLLILSALAQAGTEPCLIGYLPARGVTEFDAKRFPGLTDLILFSAEPKPDGSLDLSRLSAIPWEKLRPFQSAGGRIHICLGGWGRSENFAAVTADEKMRAKFVSEVIRFCTEHNLAGVDLDWEHPKGKEQLAAYGKLIADLHKGMLSQKGIVSITLASVNQLPRSAVNDADRIQLMAYDMPGPHSTFEASTKRLDDLIAAGVPKHKLVLGVPFYGRGVTDRNRTLPYREILLRYKLKPDQDEVDGLAFNGPATVKRKADLALQRALGGIMVWELTQDAPAEDSLFRELRLTLDSQR
ncbi:MAG TPA: hypothetical protein DCY41_07020 [Opitutae bacterium]|nr:hypothetical protein [Opitutae bacterium]